MAGRLLARKWVERLLLGDARDLNSIFLYVRDRCSGRRSIWDVGAFVAHRFERDQGAVVEESKNWQVIATYMAACLDEQMVPKSLDLSRLPPTIVAFMKIRLDRTPDDVISREFGLDRLGANILFANLTASLVRKTDGFYAVRNSIKSTEYRLMQSLTSSFEVRPAYTAQSLINDMAEILIGDELLSIEEYEAGKPQFAKYIDLFAVSVMHKCNVVLKKPVITELIASNTSSGILVSVRLPANSRVNFGCPIYLSEFGGEEACASNLLELTDWSPFFIEINEAGKLDVS